LSEALSVQRLSIDNFELEDGRGGFNGAAIGYIYGFVDAGLQAGALDIRTSTGARALRAVLAKLAPGRARVYMAFLNKNIPHDSRVMHGVIMGGRECKIWLASGNELVPGSWSECFPSLK
jgi:hypothetical protein